MFRNYVNVKNLCHKNNKTPIYIAKYIYLNSLFIKQCLLYLDMFVMYSLILTNTPTSYLNSFDRIYYE